MRNHIIGRSASPRLQIKDAENQILEIEESVDSCRVTDDSVNDVPLSNRGQKYASKKSKEKQDLLTL